MKVLPLCSSTEILELAGAFPTVSSLTLLADKVRRMVVPRGLRFHLLLRMLLAQTSQPGSDKPSEPHCQVELDLARESFFTRLLKVTEVRAFQL